MKLLVSLTVATAAAIISVTPATAATPRNQLPPPAGCRITQGATYARVVCRPPIPQPHVLTCLSFGPKRPPVGEKLEVICNHNKGRPSPGEPIWPGEYTVHHWRYVGHQVNYRGIQREGCWELPGDRDLYRCRGIDFTPDFRLGAPATVPGHRIPHGTLACRSFSHDVSAIMFICNFDRGNGRFDVSTSPHSHWRFVGRVYGAHDCWSLPGDVSHRHNTVDRCANADFVSP